MTPNTLLYRQVHPDFVQNGHPSSQAFLPTKKDDYKLSAYDGDQIKPEASWGHYTNTLRLRSIGVMAVTNAECTEENLAVIPDRNPYPEHCSIDFSNYADHSKPALKRVAKRLLEKAIKREWLYQAQ